MIVHRLRRFPKQYQGDIINFSMYCNSMAVNGKAASTLELQAVADICFSVVECYSSNDFLAPMSTIFPVRLCSVSECTSRIRLWIKDAHCMALVSNGPQQPLIQNIFDFFFCFHINNIRLRANKCLVIYSQSRCEMHQLNTWEYDTVTDPKTGYKFPRLKSGTCSQIFNI